MKKSSNLCLAHGVPVHRMLCPSAPVNASLRAIPSQRSHKRVDRDRDERMSLVSAMADVSVREVVRRAQDTDCCFFCFGREHQARNLTALRRLAWPPQGEVISLRIP
jgi:hypothetical protein